jgi:hypothetical protein
MRLMGDEVSLLGMFYCLMVCTLYLTLTRFLLSYLHNLPHLYVLMCLDFVCLFSWLPISRLEYNSKVKTSCMIDVLDQTF